jgi:putative toxin-antitoxin system antitoxin component (TIGR02293 family)
MMGQSIGIQAGRLEDVIGALKKGLPVSALHKLCQHMGVTESRLATTVNIAQRTLTRRKSEGRLRRDESERVLRIARLFERAVEVLGSEQSAQQWFQSPVRGFGGKTPLEFADTEPGAHEVAAMLDRIEDGVFY